MKRGVFILLGLILLAFLSSGIFALNDISCSIKAKAQTDSPSNVLMRLSDLTNAHGELASQANYLYEVYCNFVGTQTCNLDGTNKILGLSSDTNAHAEVPSETAYTSKVCYGDLSCIGTKDTCGTNDNAGGNVNGDDATSFPVSIVSLSATTNAHIGPVSGTGSYGTKICCGSLTYVTSAFWSKDGFTKSSKIDVVPDTTIVRMMLQNSPLAEGTKLKIEIYEDDPLFDDSIRTGADALDTIVTTTNGNGVATATWLITQADLDKGKSFDDFYEAYNNMQFYFKVFNADDNNRLITTSDNLRINVLASTFCNDKFVCGDYAQNLCTNNDPCNVAANSIPVGISCTDGTANCFCSWDSTASPEICQGVSELFTFNPTTGVKSILGKCIISATKKSGSCAQGGTISYGWTAIWTGTSDTKPASCIDGQTVLQCPAQIQLPFFGFYNFLATGLLIALIYAMLILRNKK